MTVTVKVEPPVSVIEARLDELAVDLLHPLWLWDLLGPVMEDIERDQFATEGHGAWPALAESTLAEKSRHGYPPNPLIRSEELYDSLTSAARAMHIDGDQMEWSSDVEYARYHQDGTDRMPQRKVIDLDSRAYAKIHEAQSLGLKALLRVVTW